ncbi:MAG: NADH-quinone oxidoreductase subunit NuoK [Planctomycetota bacterium]|nr:NADH-quinone oxidoreductase subunit NuoK [Planctomycetota bacterium]
MTLVAALSIQPFLYLSAALFCAGLIAVLSRRNAVAILIGIELMLNAANINLVAFDRFRVQVGDAPVIDGQLFALLVLAIAAAEAAVALALILNVFDTRDRIDVDELDLLKG